MNVLSKLIFGVFEKVKTRLVTVAGKYKEFFFTWSVYQFILSYLPSYSHSKGAKNLKSNVYKKIGTRQKERSV